jgi:hypothetical protein
MFLSTLSRKAKEYILIVLQAFTLRDKKRYSYFCTLFNDTFQLDKLYNKFEFRKSRTYRICKCDVLG